MKKLISVLSVFFVFSTVIVNTAATSASAKVGPAGCGLGNMLLGGRDSQVLAATTNGTGTQTFGITSGTSNCVDKADNSAMMIQFIDVNQAALKKDAARGDGETIAGLARVMGCGDHQALGLSMKDHFGSLFPENAEATQISTELQRILKDQPSLAAQCGTAS